MAGPILSSGVRNNLLTLQQTTSQQNVIQNRLATGKTVNSAIDNPVNYFTSLSLNDRSSQLNGLLDGISNGIQTIQSASKGIDGITKLVQSLQSTVKQAQADAAQNRPTITTSALSTATETAATSKSLKDIALDKSVTDVAGGTVYSAGPPVVTGKDAATATSSGDLGVPVGSSKMAISIKIGSGDPATGGTTTNIQFDSANVTVRDIVNKINGSGVATAFVDEQGKLNIKGNGSDQIQVGVGAAGTSQGALDGATGTTPANSITSNLGFNTTTGTSQNSTSAVRSNLIQQFNDLRTQIDQLAKDASFNGINLLQGDRLSIVFNEKTGTNQTKLDIQGSTLSADNLGIPQAVNTQLLGFFNFQNDSDLDKATAALTSSLTSLKSLSSTLGSNLSVAQTRQDFTKELSNVLTQGADKLVAADSNAEGASLLALNTRQQLSQTALSLANQADQGVLRLFQ